MTAIDTTIDAGSAAPRQRSGWMRVLLAIPVIGWIARDLLEGGPDTIYYLLAAVFSLLVVAVMTWGIMVLTLVAVALVPVMFTLLIWITWG